jgi:peptide-methionine (R)-S-oxide reductase
MKTGEIAHQENAVSNSAHSREYADTPATSDANKIASNAQRAGRTPERTQDLNPDDPQPSKSAFVKTDAEWKQLLDPKAYAVLREKGTERAFSGKYWNTPASTGEYRCAACAQVLFRGSDKFVSDCGWPAFDKAIKGTITYKMDKTFGMIRTEVVCSRCAGHLGHIFDDGPTDSGMRYCINSVSITYHEDGSATKDAPTEAGE